MSGLLAAIGVAIAVIRHQEGVELNANSQQQNGQGMDAALCVALGNAVQRKTASSLSALQLLVGGGAAGDLRRAVLPHLAAAASPNFQSLLLVLSALCGVQPAPTSPQASLCARPSLEAVAMCVFDHCQQPVSPEATQKTRLLTTLFVDGLVALTAREPREETDDWIVSMRAALLDHLGPMTAKSTAAAEAFGEVSCIPRLDNR